MPRYIPDKDFPQDEKNRMLPMKYGSINTPIFPNGELHPEKIRQSEKATCWILASLISLAKNNPELIKNLFTENGDGTVTIHFNPLIIVAGDITIDKTLPDTDTASPDWVRLLEKGLAAAGVDVGIEKEHPPISMGNLNWGHPDLFLQMIDRKNTGNFQLDVAGFLAESKDKTELISKFTEFCNKVTEKHGSIMIQTSKHNMSVTEIKDGTIYYYDQLSNSNNSVRIASLFKDNSTIENLLFSLQGQNLLSVNINIEPKTVLHNMNAWNNASDPVSGAAGYVNNFLLNLSANYFGFYGINLNMFGQGYNIEAFVNNSDCMKKIFKESGCQNYAEFHRKLRSDYDQRKAVAEAYFNFLADHYDEKKYKINRQGFDAGITNWRGHVNKNSVYMAGVYFENSLDNYGTREADRKTYELKVSGENKESMRRYGEKIVLSEKYVKNLSKLWHAAKFWSGNFKNSEKWKDFRHSLHMTSRLAKAADLLVKSVKKDMNYQGENEDLLKEKLENSTLLISRLDTITARYIEDYCSNHKIEDVKEGKISYGLLCRILGSSWQETQKAARRYVDYKMKKFELPEAEKKPIQENARNAGQKADQNVPAEAGENAGQKADKNAPVKAEKNITSNKKKAVRKKPSTDDLNKLKIVGIILNEEIKIPGYEPHAKALPSGTVQNNAADPSRAVHKNVADQSGTVHNNAADPSGTVHNNAADQSGPVHNNVVNPSGSVQNNVVNPSGPVK